MKSKLVFRSLGLLSILIIAVGIFSSCENNRENLKKSLGDYDLYVQGHRDSVRFYREWNWTDINNDHDKRFAVLIKDTTRMTDEIKASYHSSREKWLAFEREYELAREEQKKVAMMDTVRAHLVMSGVRTDYTDLTALNVLPAYQHFVQTVKQNKDTYTQEEWTVVNVNYKALKGRKRELEANIPSKDKDNIVRLQLEYTGIKAVNRPGAE